MKGDFDNRTNNLIIKKHEKSKAAMSGFFNLMEEFRQAASELITNGELDKVRKAIELGRKFDSKPTRKDIERLLVTL